MDKTYKIKRFVFGEEPGNQEIIKEGLTLSEAQEHCESDNTHGEGWFDAYTEEN